MKKVLFFLFLLLLTQPLWAQIEFEEEMTECHQPYLFSNSTSYSITLLTPTRFDSVDILNNTFFERPINGQSMLHSYRVTTDPKTYFSGWVVCQTIKFTYDSCFSETDTIQNIHNVNPRDIQFLPALQKFTNGTILTQESEYDDSVPKNKVTLLFKNGTKIEFKCVSQYYLFEQDLNEDEIDEFYLVLVHNDENVLYIYRIN